MMKIRNFFKKLPLVTIKLAYATTTIGAVFTILYSFAYSIFLKDDWRFFKNGLIFSIIYLVTINQIIISQLIQKLLKKCLKKDIMNSKILLMINLINLLIILLKFEDMMILLISFIGISILALPFGIRILQKYK